MKKIFVFLLAVAFISSLQSCKKEEDSKPSAEELLTEDSWNYYKYEEYDSDGDLSDTQTFSVKFVAAVSGDFYFHDASNQVVNYGTWELKDKDSKIDLISQVSGGIQSTFDIDKLTKDKFTISNTGQGGKIVLYFKR